MRRAALRERLHWLRVAFYDGGPFSCLYRRGSWFWRWTPQYREGWRLGVGHRMGGFWLAELGPFRFGRTRD